MAYGNDVPYKPTPPAEQGRAVAQWLIDKHGRRPSEAAMEVADMGIQQLRRKYKELVLTGVIIQAKLPHGSRIKL